MFSHSIMFPGVLLSMERYIVIVVSVCEMDMEKSRESDNQDHVMLENSPVLHVSVYIYTYTCQNEYCFSCIISQAHPRLEREVSQCWWANGAAN